MAMRVSVSAVAVAVVVEKEQAEDIRSKTEASNDQNKSGVADFLRLDKTLDGLKEDG